MNLNNSIKKTVLYCTVLGWLWISQLQIPGLVVWFLATCWRVRGQALNSRHLKWSCMSTKTFPRGLKKVLIIISKMIGRGASTSAQHCVCVLCSLSDISLSLHRSPPPCQLCSSSVCWVCVSTTETHMRAFLPLWGHSWHKNCTS